MLSPGIKRLALFLILLYFFLIRTDYTDADIFAERIVRQNRFSAKTLDFSTRTSFNNNPITSLFSSLGLQPGGFDLGAVRIKREAGGDFKYYLRAVKTNGDDLLCSRLKLEVYSRNFFKIYGGRLLDLELDSQISNDDPEDWIFFISLDDYEASLKNNICEFDFIFRTYRRDFSESGGIFAQRTIRNIISSGSW